MVALNQPVTLAAMEGLFQTTPGAPIVLIGQPNVDKHKIDNPVEVPNALSFLTYRRWEAEVKGLDAFPQDEWPTSIELLYFSYHIMVGLGTLFIAIAIVAAFLMWRDRLFSSRWMLWILLLALPFPYIANTAGWMLPGRRSVAGLPLMPRGWLFENSFGGQWNFHAAGFMGMLYGAGYFSFWCQGDGGAGSGCRTGHCICRCGTGKWSRMTIA